MRSGCEQNVALGKVEAARANMLRGAGQALRASDERAIDLGIFLDQDAVGARRKMRASRDSRRFASRKRTGKGRTGTRFSNEPPRPFAAPRIAIHCGERQRPRLNSNPS